MSATIRSDSRALDHRVVVSWETRSQLLLPRVSVLAAAAAVCPGIHPSAVLVLCPGPGLQHLRHGDEEEGNGREGNLLTASPLPSEDPYGERWRWVIVESNGESGNEEAVMQRSTPFSSSLRL